MIQQLKIKIAKLESDAYKTLLYDDDSHREGGLFKSPPLGCPGVFSKRYNFRAHEPIE